MKNSSLLSFIIKSILMGVLLSLVLLLLVPQLRQHSAGTFSFFNASGANTGRISFHNAVRSAAPAVVDIYSQSSQSSGYPYRYQEKRNSLGSGVIMRDDGYILTCYHVIHDAERIYVRLFDGRVLEAQIVGQDKPTDLAVLKVNEANLPVIAQTETPNIEVGDVVLAIGNPLNLGQTVTQGVISATGRPGMSNIVGSIYVDYIRMDAALNEGNSGGALIDSNGVLVGINNALFKTRDAQGRVTNVPGVFFAVPYELAKKVMDSLISNGRVRRGFLGITGSDSARDESGMRLTNGVVITDLEAGGPAANAGFRAGDLLTKINGEQIQNIYQVLDVVAESEPGTVLNFEVVRDKQLMSIAVTLGEMQTS